MPRGADAKLRRRQNRQSEREAGDAAQQFLDGAADDGDDPALPLPPRAAGAGKPQRVLVETVDSDDEDGDDNNKNGDYRANLPKRKGKPSKARAGAPAPSAAPPARRREGIKTTPLILLCCLLGTTLLPVLIYAGDYFASRNVLGQIGFRLGVGAVPRRRVVSFYEKHDPAKLGSVPTILANHYGKYPELIRKLERKYQDYGYFLNWEQDEAPLTKALEGMRAGYDTWLREYWNRYAPQVLKTAFRNIRYNLGTLYKKGSKIWKKKLWPLLEPVFGVPKGTERQKRQDAADARARQRASGKTAARRKSQEFRDDPEEA